MYQDTWTNSCHNITMNLLEVPPVLWDFRFGGLCGVRSVENAECGKCGVWKMRSVENAECGKCGV